MDDVFDLQNPKAKNSRVRRAAFRQANETGIWFIPVLRSQCDRRDL